MATESQTIPQTMRAWIRQQRGPAHRGLRLTTLPTPTPPPHSSQDVLIRVSHVSLQYTTEALLKTIPSLPLTGPWIPELELSGEIVAAGSGVPPEVRDLGTQVIAFQNIPAVMLGHGVLAEYVLLPGSQVSPIEGIDMASASGINGSGSTALKMIRTVGVRERHSVLVNGASGSVGSVLAQLCKMRGARVVGVASGANEGMVRGLGVDEVG